MRKRILASTAAALLVAALASCAQTPSAAPVDASTPTPGSPPATPTVPATPEQSAPAEVVGTVVRLTSDRTSVDVTTRRRYGFGT